MRLMDKQTVWGYIDHTLLKAAASWEEIQKLCDEAEQYHPASVCVPPAFVAPINKAYGRRVIVCTVIGFPLGYNTTRCKVEETREVLSQGAGEVDMVINLGLVKTGNFAAVEEEIRAIREVSSGAVLKVIIETCYLTAEEKIKLCGIVSAAGADYIKTSTGFGSAGATLEDIRLFKEHIGEGVQIKAAGGIGTLAELEAYIAAGCSRIGTSRGVSILEGGK
jgi:deoxyribose-phosphate aldolase